MITKSKIKILYICLAIILTIFFYGFLKNEDLSSGGAHFDFNLTWPVVIDFSNLNFLSSHEYTRHFPLHYFVLSFVYNIFGNQDSVRIFYLFFSLLLPLFVYLNLSILYRLPNINLLVLSFSITLLPFFRSSAIWPNAHLTALIFLTISNFFYLKFCSSKKISNIYFNLIFLAFAVYSMQSYLVFYIYYLIKYFKEKKNIFKYIIPICFVSSLPGFLILFYFERSTDLNFSKNFFYSLATQFSIMSLFLSIFFFNKESFLIFKNIFFKFKKFEFILIFIFFIFIVFGFENAYSTGGGFFYKTSIFLFNNEIFFLITFLIGLIMTVVILKNDKNFFLLLMFVNFTSLNWVVYQKYFEPIMVVIILCFLKNFLTFNIARSIKNIYIFIILLFGYYSVALTNTFFKFSTQF